MAWRALPVIRAASLLGNRTGCQLCSILGEAYVSATEIHACSVAPGVSRPQIHDMRLLRLRLDSFWYSVTARSGIRCDPGAEPNPQRTGCVSCVGTADRTVECIDCEPGKGPPPCFNLTGCVSCEDFLRTHLLVHVRPCFPPNVVLAGKTICQPAFRCPAGSQCADEAFFAMKLAAVSRAQSAQLAQAPVVNVVCNETGQVANVAQSACVCSAGHEPASTGPCAECVGTTFSSFGIQWRVQEPNVVDSQRHRALHAEL